jgi:AcrR family transcriptional regulator
MLLMDGGVAPVPKERSMAKTRTTQAVRRQVTRARLLEAAYAVFAAQGYTGATIDAIVQAAGYSKGAFYFHFSSKEEVFLEVLWSRARNEEQALRTAGQGTQGRPFDLLRGVAAYLGPGADDPLWPALLLEFWSHASRNARVREGVASVARFRRDALLHALQAAAEAGVISPSLRLDHCADLLVTLGDGLVARAGTAQADVAADYLPGVVAQLLGVEIGPRVVADTPAPAVAKPPARPACEPAPAVERPANIG